MHMFMFKYSLKVSTYKLASAFIKQNLPAPIICTVTLLCGGLRWLARQVLCASDPPWV